MPDLKVVWSTSFRWVMSTPAKSRSPFPTKTGKIQKWYSSTSLCSSSVRSSPPVPIPRDGRRMHGAAYGLLLTRLLRPSSDSVDEGAPSLERDCHHLVAGM